LLSANGAPKTTANKSHSVSKSRANETNFQGWRSGIVANKSIAERLALPGRPGTDRDAEGTAMPAGRDEQRPCPVRGRARRSCERLQRETSARQFRPECPCKL